jgi:hypothetical protein
MASENKLWEVYKKYYLNRWVRIHKDGTTKHGVLRDATFDYIILQPSVVNETVSNEDKSLEIRLENDTPSIISMPVSVIEPLSEDYVRKSLKRYPIKSDDNQLSLF